MEYPLIQAYGEIMDSKQWYIDMQVALAKKDNAPANVYRYCDHENRWLTIDVLMNSNPSFAREVQSRIHKSLNIK